MDTHYISPPIPDDEAERLQALWSYAVLDSPPEIEFDRITNLAKRIFGTEIAVVSLVDADRQWFKSCVGLDAEETPREVSFCGHTILNAQVMVVPDARRDRRFARNPLVTGAPFIRFYAGAPLVTPEGHRLGTLCLIDDQPRSDFGPREAQILSDLAAIVMDALEIRRQMGDRAVTYRRRLEQLSTAIEAAHDGILLTDSDLRIVFVNPAAIALAAVSSADDLLGRSVLDVASEEGGARLSVGLDKILSGDERHWRVELFGSPTLEYPVPAELSMTALDDGHLLFVVRDVSERLAAERERDSLRDRLAHAEKLQAIGRLAGGIAHDFNNILSGIVGYGTLLKDELQGEGQPDRAAMAEQILSGASRAGDLVSQILTFSRSRQPKTESVDLRLPFQEAERMLRATLPATIQLSVDVPAVSVPVLANFTQLHQVILNLAVNARDAFGTGCGHIECRLDTLTPDDVSAMNRRFSRQESGCLWLGPVPEQPVARLVISDSGPGIGETELKQIFDPFFTTKKHGEGTGLGLAAVHGIVASHNGSVMVESRAGEGACFTVLLPLLDTPEPAQSGGTAEVCSAGQPADSVTLLLVDDEAPIRDAGRRLLERRGYRVDVAATAQAALDQLRRAAEPPAAIITDHAMPVMSGLELLSICRETYPEMKRILATGYLDEQTERSAEDAGAQALVKKPLDIDKLIDVIADLMV